MEKVLIGTTNKGKVRYIQDLMVGTGFEFLSLTDMSKQYAEPVEIGDSPAQIATDKAKYYAKKYGMQTLSIDYGLYFEGIAADEQPGVYVKRVDGEELNAEEMLIHYQDLVRRYGGKLPAYWLRAFAITSKTGTVVYEGTDCTTFVAKLSPATFHQDHPLASMQLDQDGRYRAEKYEEQVTYAFDSDLRSYLLAHLK